MESNKNIWYIGLGIAAVAAIIFMLLQDYPNVRRAILYTVLSLGSVFIILLVLIQRGRGGGLAGALGGMGGYSAFGTRAGDIFTRITIVAAAIWLLAAMALARINATPRAPYENPGPASAGTSDTGKETDESSNKVTSPTPSEGTEPIDKKTGGETDSKSQ